MLGFNNNHSFPEGDGVVYIWDMSTRDCIHTFIDDGCISGTSLSLSLNNQYIACGSVATHFGCIPFSYSVL